MCLLPKSQFEFLAGSEGGAEGGGTVGEKQKVADQSKRERSIEQVVLEKSNAPQPVALSTLVREISDDSTYQADEVVSEILKLRAEGRIIILEPAPYTNLQAYLFSPASVSFWEVMIATLSALGLIFVSSGLGLYPRYVFGGFLVLFLPGYSVVSLIYPKEADLDKLTRLVLSFAMSFAVVSLLGLGLSYTPFGISLSAAVFSLGLITIGLAFLTTARKYENYKLARRIGAGSSTQMPSPQREPN
jgi:uncharacterized membrane protein